MKKLVYGLCLSLLVALATGCASSSKPPVERNAKAAEINTQLGVNYLNSGDLQQADIKLRRALKQNPGLAIAHWSFALLQSRLGDYPLAEKHFRKAISLEPKDSRARNNYGVFLCSRGRIREAEEQFVAAVRNPLYTEAASAYTNAGICALKREDPKKAENYFRDALSQDAKYSPALFQMAKVAFETERYLQTQAYLQRYLEVARHNPGTLWLSIQTESRMGNRDSAASMAVKLKNLFPTSRETALLLEFERNGY